MKYRTLLALICVTTFAASTQAGSKASPFTAIAGRWQHLTKISSVTTDQTLKNMNYSWTGKIHGVIEPTGSFSFNAENGCQITGNATPFASTTLWALEASLTNCPFDHLNQRVFGNIRKEGAFLIIKATDSPFAVGKPPVQYEIKATLGRY